MLSLLLPSLLVLCVVGACGIVANTPRMASYRSCTRCAYDLTGTPGDRVCPECGAAQGQAPHITSTTFTPPHVGTLITFFPVTVLAVGSSVALAIAGYADAYYMLVAVGIACAPAMLVLHMLAKRVRTRALGQYALILHGVVWLLCLPAVVVDIQEGNSFVPLMDSLIVTVLAFAASAVATLIAATVFFFTQRGRI